MSGEGGAGSSHSPEEPLSAIAEHLDVGVWVYPPDFSSITYFNPASLRIWGLTEAEANENHVAFLQRVDPEDLPKLQAAMQQLKPTELVVRATIGGRPRHLCIRGVPVYDDTGAIRSVVGLTEDVTARTESERALARSEDRLRQLIEHSPSPIYALGMAGRFTAVNSATERLLQRPATELIGLHYREVVHPDDHAAAEQALRALLSGDRAQLEVELRTIVPEGEPHLLRLAVTPIRDRDGIAGIQGIAADVSAERAREQHLQRAERFAAIGTLLSGVAHELNNPLQAIAGFSELLLEMPHQSDQAEALRTIAREARRASGIVADLRRISRGSHEAEETRTAVDLNDVVEHIARTRSYALRSSNIELVVDLSPRTPHVLADRNRVEQVLLNLVVNAEHALARQPGPRQIHIRTRPTVRGGAVTVRDNGPGIRSPSICPVCSTRSSPRRRSARGPGWGSPSFIVSSTNMAAPSTSRAHRGTAPSSRWTCPALTNRLRNCNSSRSSARSSAPGDASSSSTTKPRSAASSAGPPHAAAIMSTPPRTVRKPCRSSGTPSMRDPRTTSSSPTSRWRG